MGLNYFIEENMLEVASSFPNSLFIYDFVFAHIFHVKVWIRLDMLLAFGSGMLKRF
jgi:hypothetical protein